MTQIRKVVIAGGGTAGWIAGCALAHQFRDMLDITLIESEQIGTIGVGEATLPPLRQFHRFVQIDEQQFLRAVAGTFKLSISFEHWGQAGERYMHPFGLTGQSTLVCAFHHFWLEAQRRGLHSELGDYCLESAAARADRFAHQAPSPLNYAYHLDAGLYARLLRAHAEQNGLRRVEGKICQVRQHPENGSITALQLEDGQVIDGDLFIDCTGFRGVLIEQTLHSGYEDWSHWLPCDRAVAVQTEAVAPPVPYTRTIAHGAGWRWQIPLQHRVGCGLVYSSAHLSDDAAHAQLLREVAAPTLKEPSLVPFRTGRRQKTWNKNVIALGLASGFIEPLESTSIHLTITAVMRLLALFPIDGIAPSLETLYNAASRAEMEHVRDFVILHYHATRREEPMWRACREMPLPASLQQRLDAWRTRAHVWQHADELFRGDSWAYVLLGQGMMPDAHHPLARALSDQELQRFLATIRAPIERSVAQMPSQAQFIAHYCKAPPQVWARSPTTALANA